MASFAPNKIDTTEINGGQRYQNGDIVSPEAINAPIEASAWAQQIAEEAVAKADQALNYGIGNTQGTFPVLTAYPIGAIFTTRSSTNPAELFGGYWLRIKDAFLWASGDTASITYTENGISVTKSLSVGSSGGEYNHALTIDEMPSHGHIQKTVNADANDTNQWLYAEGTGTSRGTTTTNRNNGWSWLEDGMPLTTENAGGGQPHNIMPPYYAVNAWVRVTEEEFNANASL